MPIGEHTKAQARGGVALIKHRSMTEPRQRIPLCARVMIYLVIHQKGYTQSNEDKDTETTLMRGNLTKTRALFLETGEWGLI